jgi:hypothetical protein
VAGCLSAVLGLQVDQLDSAARSGGSFNQPQYLHLKESISSIIQHLNNLQVNDFDQVNKGVVSNPLLFGEGCLYK